MVDRFAVDVKHQSSQRGVGEGTFGRAAGPVEPLVARVSDAVEPHGDLALQLGQRAGSGGSVGSAQSTGARAKWAGVRIPRIVPILSPHVA